MLRSELDLVKRIIANFVDPLNETNNKRFKAIEKQLADLKKEIEDLKKPKPTVQVKDKK